MEPHETGSPVSLVLKRWIDLLVAGTALVILSPLLPAVGISILLTLGRPVLFRQERPGYKQRKFVLYKFRTMTQQRDREGSLMPDGQRLTRLGGLLRSLSIDELPQLWNVVKGELSLVGPRPLLVEYLDYYTPEQRRRHDVMPGITGWAQIHGRQDIPFSKRLEYDVWYVDHWSLWLDAKILLLTLLKVVLRSGVRSGQDVTEVDDLGINQATRRKKECIDD